MNFIGVKIESSCFFVFNRTNWLQRFQKVKWVWGWGWVTLLMSIYLP